MKSNNRRPSGNIMMRLAAVLFCLVMFSTYLMGGLFARYTAKASGEDKARVAAFQVVTTGDDNVDVVYSQNSTGQYDLTVTNNSEVAISYTIQVDVSPIDFGILVELDDTQLNTTESTQVTVNPPPLAPGKDAPHKLTFRVINWGEFTKFVSEQPNHTQQVTFTITVDAVQVD